jgi:hypothetical protein
MALIAEPVGIDLNISPMTLTLEDRQVVSSIIAQYKNTGEIPVFVKKSTTKKLLKKPKLKRKSGMKRLEKAV